MKLHLPLALRATLLALFSLASSVQAEIPTSSYWIEFSNRVFEDEDNDATDFEKDFIGKLIETDTAYQICIAEEGEGHISGCKIDDVLYGYAKGGAIYFQSGASLNVSGENQKSTLRIENNYIYGGDGSYGGVFYMSSDNSITLQNHGNIYIGNNSAKPSMRDASGAVLASLDSEFIVRNNAYVLVENNGFTSTASADAEDRTLGVFYGERSTFQFCENGNMTFTSNVPICEIMLQGGTLDISDNKDVEFKTTQHYRAWGGDVNEDGLDDRWSAHHEDWLDFSTRGIAIFLARYNQEDETIVEASGRINNNTSITFSSYIDHAIYVNSADFSICLNDKVTFEDNMSLRFAKGGVRSGAALAIVAPISSQETYLFDISENGDVSFNNNTVTASLSNLELENKDFAELASGGAIRNEEARLQFTKNTTVSFTENTVRNACHGKGGAIHAGMSGSTLFDVLSFRENGSVLFEDNYATGTTASVPSYGGGSAMGGAICIENGICTFAGNDQVVFNGNHIVYAPSSSQPPAANNKPIVGGGAIALHLAMSYPLQYSVLNFDGNDYVELRNNYEYDRGVYRMRSIYANADVYSGMGICNYIVFNTEENQKISIYDSFTSDGAVLVNVKFNEQNVSFSTDGTGGIVELSGKYIEEDLAKVHEISVEELKASYASEIELSKTSTAMQLLLGDGQYIVSDGACLRAVEFETEANSGGQFHLRNAALEGTYAKIEAGSYFVAQGQNRVSTALTLTANSVLKLEISEANKNAAILTFNSTSDFSSSFTISSGAQLQLFNTESLSGGDYILLSIAEDALSDESNWTHTVSGLSWVDAGDYYNLVWTSGSTGPIIPNPDPVPDPDIPGPDVPETPEGPQSLVWSNAKNAVWQQGADGWWNDAGKDAKYRDEDAVTIGDGTVTIVGDVTPASILLNPDKALTFKTKYDKKAGEWSGAITGETEVTIAAGPKGKVTMNDGNDYTGTTTIKSGTVNVGGADSFGESTVTLSGGTLDLKSKAVANAIALAGEAAIKGGAKYEGEFTMTDGELLKGSVLNVAEKATLVNGEVSGTLSGAGTVYVTGDVELGDTAKLTTNGLNISGKLEVGSKGLAMNAKSSAITIAGGTLESEGKLSANSLKMGGGVLSVYNAKPMDLTFKGGQHWKPMLLRTFTATSQPRNWM